MVIVVEVSEILDSGAFGDLEKKAKDLGFENPNLRNFVILRDNDESYERRIVNNPPKSVLYLTNHGSDPAMIYQENITEVYKLARFRRAPDSF